MTDYLPLISYWNTLPQPLAGDIVGIRANLVTINAHSIDGPLVDISVGDVVGYLALAGKLLSLESYASSGIGNATALAGAKMLSAISANQMPITHFRMSDATTAEKLEGMLSAMVTDAGTSLTTEDQAAIMAMAKGPMLVWHLTPVAQGGAGLPGLVVNAWDLYNAELISSDDAHAVESAQ